MQLGDGVASEEGFGKREPEENRGREQEEEEDRTVKRALVGLSVFLFMFDFFSGGNGRRRGGIVSIIAEAGGGTSGGGGGGSGEFWRLQPSNVSIALAVTAMAGLALAATVVYSR